MTVDANLDLTLDFAVANIEFYSALKIPVEDRCDVEFCLQSKRLYFKMRSRFSVEEILYVDWRATTDVSHSTASFLKILTHQNPRQQHAAMAAC